MRVLELGIDAILEWGFWSRVERGRLAAMARERGFRVEVRSLAVPFEELWSRIEARNAVLPPGTFRVERADLDLWWSDYKPRIDARTYAIRGAISLSRRASSPGIVAEPQGLRR